MTHEKFSKAQAEYYTLRDKLREQIKPYDLTLSEWSMLEVVNQSPGIAVSQVANKLGFSLAFATVTLQKLASKGLVEASDNLDDKRKRSYATTENGRSLVEEIQIVLADAKTL